MPFSIFENLSCAATVGVTILDICGEVRFMSSVYKSSSAFLLMLSSALDCNEADQVALIYGCYQARRFGGRYIFLAPSGLAYCTSPLTDEKGEMETAALAGPFLMTDHAEYIDIDILSKHSLDAPTAENIRSGIHVIPVKTPVQARAISEQLFVSAVYYSRIKAVEAPALKQVDALAYSIEKEGELLSAISLGDINAASAVLNDILGQVLFHSGRNLEVLRSRVVELTVLLSRAALKGGANIDAILGLNYSYLREIDALSSTEDIIFWLHNVTRRFAQHVFDYAGAKHVDVIYKAIAFIKRNYANKITLQDIADSVFMNVTYFSKVFKEETGQTPGSYIAAVRIEEGKKLLCDLSVNIVDIPELIGFESQSYFTQVFKKSENCTPGRFRQKRIESSDVHA